MADIIGKIVATIDRPSTVDSFTFWLKSGKESAIEVGNIVTVQDGDEKVYGMVTEMKSYTDAEGAMVDYLSHEFGDPEVEAPTLRQCIHLAICEVIGASKPRVRPVSAGKARLATAEEIVDAYGMNKITDPILVGVIPNGRRIDNYAPALLSEEFIIGPEGAHVNFSGASGLATKTSAAVFIIRSILSRARKEQKKIAVVAFNVKERDLLCLEKHSDDGLSELLEAHGEEEERKIIDIMREYNVTLKFDRKCLHYYAPGRPRDPDTPHSLRQDGVKAFYWSLESVKNKEAPIRLEHMLDPDDLDERAIGVLSTIEDELEGAWADVEHFRGLLNQFPTDLKNWHGHSGHTVAKVRRLLRVNTSEILRGLFSFDDAKQQDLPLEKLKAGQCFVIDIQTLNDKGKRIVFFNILKRLANMLERYKSQRDQEVPVPLDAVIVFVDELNKFAPHGRSVGRGLKEQIIEIAARGRSVGLILFGAEQFASGIDKEVYGNCSTHFVGRTEQVELGERVYRWISRDLSYITSNLRKGSLLCKHALFGRPVLLRFPRPLYTYQEQDVDKLLKREKQKVKPKVSVKSDYFGSKQWEILKTVSESPTKYYKQAHINQKIGIGQQKFMRWYRYWVSNGKYHEGSKNEKKAFSILMENICKDL